MSPWHVLTAVVALIGLILPLFDERIWFSAPAFRQWRKRLSQRLWAEWRPIPDFLWCETNKHILLSAPTQIWVVYTSCSRWTQSNTSDCHLEKKKKKKKKSFVIYIFIQRVGFIFLLCIEDNYSSFFLFVFPSGSVRISKTVDLHLCGGFHACFSKEQHSIARQKNSIGTTEKHPIPFTSMPSVSILGRCYRTKGLNARVHEKEEGLNGCLLINNENSLTL